MKNSESTSPKSRKKKALVWTISLAVVLGILAGFTALFTGFFQRMHMEAENVFFHAVTLKSGVYEGNTFFGWLDGEGTFTFNTGETYSGQWKLSEMEGKGTLRYPKEGVYEGSFEGSRNSGNGIFTWKDGDRYEGEFFDDLIQGKGIYFYADGARFEGEFFENKILNGEYYYTDGNDEYVLSYQNGSLEGAAISFENGVFYEGKIAKEGLFGSGKMTYPNGDSYSGEYIENVRCGTGTYTWENGDSYVGEWEQDTMNGEGTYSFFSGSRLVGTFLEGVFVSGQYIVESETATSSYKIDNQEITQVSITVKSDDTKITVSYTNGKPSEVYQIDYSNGDKYVGAMKEWKRNGTGVYTWTNGSKYDGAWSNDAMNGQGVYYYPPGGTAYKLEGRFQNNKPIGFCKYYLSANDSYYYGTTWENGNCVKVTEYKRWKNLIKSILLSKNHYRALLKMKRVISQQKNSSPLAL